MVAEPQKCLVLNQTLLNQFVSIIIPCIYIDDYVKECVKHCEQQTYRNFEVILLPDEEAKEEIKCIKIIATGQISPGAKRNIGIKASNGEICAFIDADAFPREDWLSNAMNYFNDPEVAAVGGPGVTPKEDSLMQKASGYVLASRMMGRLANRRRVADCLESLDVPSCNLMVRKTVLKQISNWNEKYWPGEDTLICMAIKKTGKKLIDANDVVVFHHCRPLLVPHLKQISRFGLHRGFFAKKFKGNSLRLIYFVPSSLLLYFFGLCFVFLFFPFFLDILFFSIFGYFFLNLLVTFVEVREVKLLLPVFVGIIATHVVYGLYFLMGLTKHDLSS